MIIDAQSIAIDVFHGWSPCNIRHIASQHAAVQHLEIVAQMLARLLRIEGADVI